MRLLLDTHILLSVLDEGDVELSEPMLDAITADNSRLFVSVVTLWEIAIKFRSGRLKLDVPIMQIPDACTALGATLLPIQSHHVLADVTPVPSTRDPFDRLLLAQAQCEDMRLITFDRALINHPLAWISSGNPN
jgi:PIN domain nuclease of toxin-antitoxin system